MKKSLKVEPIDSTYQSVKQILEEARKKAYTAVNFAMVQAYWSIGRIIVEEEQKGKATAGYGEYLINELAARLTAEFGKGFTISNIKYFRQFYLSFSIGHALRGQSQIAGKMDDAIRHESRPVQKGHALRDELPGEKKDRYIISWAEVGD